MTDSTAVPISGEAFTVLTVVFVGGMLLIALSRLFAKRRSIRRARANGDGDSGYVGDGDSSDRSSDHGGGSSDGGDGGGGGD